MTGTALAVSGTSIEAPAVQYDASHVSPRLGYRETRFQAPDVAPGQAVSSIVILTSRTEGGPISPSERSAANVERLPARATGSEAQEYSRAFARLRVNQCLREAAEALAELRRSVGTTESAVWASSLRGALADAWKFIPPDEVHFAHAVATVQATMRFERWRDLNPHKVDMLRRALEIMRSRRLGFDDRTARDVISVLYSGRMDVFPSVVDETVYGVDDGGDHEPSRVLLPAFCNLSANLLFVLLQLLSTPLGVRFVSYRSQVMDAHLAGEVESRMIDYPAEVRQLN